jgi:high-affinity nickel-transport protein
MRFATLYALGHASVVFALGTAAILVSAEIPASLDAAMGRLVGATLIALGVYVFYSLVRHGRNFRMRSRWMLLFSGVRRGYLRLRRTPAMPVVIEHDHPHSPAEAHAHAPARVPVGGPGGVHRHGHRHIAPLPDDPFMNYGRATAWLVGMIHGVGAETPTQVIIFATAAGAGGRGAGLLVLGCFIVGLLASNTAVSLASTFGFLNAAKNWPVYATMSVVTGVFSLVVGALFLFGHDTALPAIFGG